MQMGYINLTLYSHHQTYLSPSSPTSLPTLTLPYLITLITLTVAVGHRSGGEVTHALGPPNPINPTHACPLRPRPRLSAHQTTEMGAQTRFTTSTQNTSPPFISRVCMYAPLWALF